MVARQDSPLLWLALRLVGVASLLVPGASRAEWKREWRAELWHHHRSLEGGTARDEAAFLLRALGSALDALQLRAGDAQAWSESLSAVVTRWGQHTPSVTVGLLFLSVGIAADTLLLAFGRVMLGVPLSPWATLLGEGRTAILGVAVTCGVGLIVASAAAAAHLLATAEAVPRGARSARVVEMLLIAGVTAWVARWLALVGVRSITPPHAQAWLAPVDLGAAVTSAWLVSWALGLTLLVVVRSLRRHPLH